LEYFKEVYEESDGVFDSHDALVFEEFGINIYEFSKINDKVEFDCSGL
jgi:hypothetical protein